MVASWPDGIEQTHLWQHGKEFPNETVTFPQAISHPFPGLTSAK